MKKRSYAKSIIVLLIVFFAFLLCAFSVVGFNSDRVYYANAYKEAIAHKGNEIRGEMIPGKKPLEHALSFDMSCSVDQKYGDSDSAKWQAAAKGLWDTTHVQLYHLKLDAPIGEGTNIKSTFDAKQYCEDYIKTLPNVDIAIVCYEFVGGEYEDKYISLYDQLYYGSSALNYLSATDMQMINTVVSRAYDFFPDYTTRDSKVWELIGLNLRDGYDRDYYTSDSYHYDDFDIEYFRDKQQDAITGMCISCGIGTVLLFIFFVICYRLFVVEPRLLKAQIEESEARAVREILEAKIPDAADDLVDKYLGD